MTMTDSPALAAIWTSRPRNFPVGIPETARRKSRPRLPREGRLPVRSRPSARALGEIKVFDHDGARIAGLGGGDQSADSGSQVPVAGGRRQPSQIQTDGGRGAEDVAVWCDDSGSEMAVVDVDSHHR